MKPKPRQPVLVALLLIVGLSLLVVGCMGAGQSGATTPSARTTQELAQLPVSSQTGTSVGGMNAEALSTFKSKDPFIQQALPPPPTTTTTTGPSVSTSTTYYGTTTTYHGTTTTYHGTTTTYHGVSTTTTVHSTTTTTALHRHSLKVLSVGVVGTAAAVTLKVDNTIYKDKRVGDVMSTSWGQVKVLDLSTASGPLRVFTLLHAARPVLLDFGAPGGLNITPWADRVKVVDAKYDGPWELPAIGLVTAPAAVLIRPDGYVAWVGDGTQSGLTDALTAWFGPRAAWSA